MCVSVYATSKRLYQPSCTHLPLHVISEPLGQGQLDLKLVDL